MSTSPPGLLALVEKAEAATDRARSARMRFTETLSIAEGGRTYGGSVTGRGLVSFSGPEELEMSTVSEFPGLGRELERTITIGSTSYTWTSGIGLPGEEKWTEEPASDDANALVTPGTSSQVLAVLLQAGATVARAPMFWRAGVGYGVLSYSISPARVLKVLAAENRATITADELRQFARVYPGGISGAVYLAPSGLLWRVTAHTTTVGAGTRTTDILSLTFFDYGLTVRISPPPAREVLTVPSTVPPLPTTSVPATSTPANSES